MGSGAAVCARALERPPFPLSYHIALAWQLSRSMLLLVALRIRRSRYRARAQTRRDAFDSRVGVSPCVSSFGPRRNRSRRRLEGQSLESAGKAQRRPRTRQRRPCQGDGRARRLGSRGSLGAAVAALCGRSVRRQRLGVCVFLFSICFSPPSFSSGLVDGFDAVGGEGGNAARRDRLRICLTLSCGRTRALQEEPPIDRWMEKTFLHKVTQPMAIMTAA